MILRRDMYPVKEPVMQRLREEFSSNSSENRLLGRNEVGAFEEGLKGQPGWKRMRWERW